MPSRVIRRFEYRPVERETGRRYIFHEVPPEAAEAFRSAFSKGRHFNAHIRRRYRFTERDPGAGAKLNAD